MKISMVMPIYNEERLLPYHLELAAPYLDEIILVDGGPEGPSTDGGFDKIDFKNVKVIEGTFELHNRKGGWDKGNQLKAGVEAASGEVVVITSCDCPYSDYELLVDTVNVYPDGKVYYCMTREFFIDIDHVRLVNQNGYPLPLVGYPFFKKNLFTPQEPGLFAANLVEPTDYIYMADVCKYHYGWVTDFKKQVAKHIRNVRSGWWHEYGENILAGGEKTLHAWAITHVLNYKREIAFVAAMNEHHPFGRLEFSYTDNFDQVIADFREKFNDDYYNCVS